MLSSGNAPPNVPLNATTGMLPGTPTANGTFNFTVRATDTNNCLGEGSYTLTINPLCLTITVNPVTVPNGLQGAVYSQMLTATGGTAPYTFASTEGSLHNGLNLASEGGLTGTPTAAGAFHFTVTATDNNDCTGTRSYTVIVNGDGLQFYPLAALVRLLDTRPDASPNACSQPNAPITGRNIAYPACTQLLRYSGHGPGPYR